MKLMELLKLKNKPWRKATREKNPTEFIVIQWAELHEENWDKTLASGKGIFDFLVFYRWNEIVPLCRWYKWKILGHAYR